MCIEVDFDQSDATASLCRLEAIRHLDVVRAESRVPSSAVEAGAVDVHLGLFVEHIADSATDFRIAEDAPPCVLVRVGPRPPAKRKVMQQLTWHPAIVALGGQNRCAAN